MEFISPHKCTKNTSTNWIILTKHQLNTSRGPERPQRTRKIPKWLGRMKERRGKEERKQDETGSQGWGGLKERFPHLGNSPHQQEHQLVQKENLGGYQRRLQWHAILSDLWHARQSQTYTDSLCHSPVHSTLRHVSATVSGDWGLEPGVWRANPGRAVRRQPEGVGVRKFATRNVSEENLDFHRSKKWSVSHSVMSVCLHPHGL